MHVSCPSKPHHTLQVCQNPTDWYSRKVSIYIRVECLRKSRDRLRRIWGKKALVQNQQKSRHALFFLKVNAIHYLWGSVSYIHIKYKHLFRIAFHHPRWHHPCAGSNLPSQLYLHWCYYRFGLGLREIPHCRMHWSRPWPRKVTNFADFTNASNNANFGNVTSFAGYVMKLPLTVNDVSYCDLKMHPFASNSKHFT